MLGKLIPYILLMLIAASLVYVGVSWSDRGYRITELETQLEQSEARYKHLVDRAREVQKALEAQRRAARARNDERCEGLVVASPRAIAEHPHLP